MSNEDIDGEGLSSLNVSLSVVGVGTVMLLVRLKLYVGVFMTLMYGCDVCWAKFCGDRRDVGRFGVFDFSSFGEVYDKWDDESDGENVGVAQ